MDDKKRKKYLKSLGLTDDDIKNTKVTEAPIDSTVRIDPNADVPGNYEKKVGTANAMREGNEDVVKVHHTDGAAVIDITCPAALKCTPDGLVELRIKFPFPICDHDEETLRKAVSDITQTVIDHHLDQHPKLGEKSRESRVRMADMYTGQEFDTHSGKPQNDVKDLLKKGNFLAKTKRKDGDFDA